MNKRIDIYGSREDDDDVMEDDEFEAEMKKEMEQRMLQAEKVVISHLRFGF